MAPGVHATKDHIDVIPSEGCSPKPGGPAGFSGRFLSLRSVEMTEEGMCRESECEPGTDGERVPERRITGGDDIGNINMDTEELHSCPDRGE